MSEQQDTSAGSGRDDLQGWIGSLAAVLVAAAIAWAGSQGSSTLGGWPLFALCAVVAFGVQWLVFVPSFLARTEHYFDLTGSLTYLSLVALTVWATGADDPRTLLLGALVAIWALRLGTFLFLRVRADGRDTRFDEIKQSFPRFLMAWTLQGLWVFLTLSAALAAMTAARSEPLGVLAWIGLGLWVLGFGFEAVADAQKRAFKSDPANEGRFITTGLWAFSRHPNYAGEIVLWLGVFLIAAEVLAGWQWVTVLSPLFVWLLLTRISGVPLLERQAKKRWGDDPGFQAYKARTPVLWPRPPKAG
jgi:steroid 5-alpha reductase family enzyme